MAPGYSINACFMESMMGVKERFDIPESYRLSKGAAWWRIIKMVVSMYMRVSYNFHGKKRPYLTNATSFRYKKNQF